MRARFLIRVVAAITAVLLTGGCGGTDVAKGQLEEQLKTRLTNQAGQGPDLIECPGDLEAKVGATQRCVLTAKEIKVGVNVSVTAVDGAEVQYDVEVDDKPLG